MKLRYALIAAGLFVVLLVAAAIPAIRWVKRRAAILFISRAYACYSQSDWDGAVRETTIAISLDPRNPMAYGYRGYAYESKEDWDKAIRDFDTELRLDSTDESAYANRGYTYLAKRDYDRAIADLDKAVQMDPHDGESFGYRGTAYVGKSEWAKATADFNEAIRLTPNEVLIWSERGYGYAQQGLWTNALADFDHALALSPMDPEALNEKAWTLATCPLDSLRDGTEAVRLSMKSCDQTSWKAWNFLDTLAAAYAESGDFEKAVKYQTDAIAATPSGNTELGGMKDRLELYRQRKPFRDKSAAQKLEKGG